MQWMVRVTALAILAGACGDVPADAPAADGGSSGDADPGPGAQGIFVDQRPLFTSFPTLAVGADDGIVVTGSMFQAFDLGLGSLSATGMDLLLAHYTSSGSLLMARRHGAAADEFNVGAAQDATGGIRLAGLYVGSASAGGQAFPTSTMHNGFVASYALDGGHVWSTPLTSPGSVFTQSSPSIGADGDAVFTGYFETQISVGGAMRSSAGGSDGFYLRTDSGGAVQTLLSLGGSGRDEATAAVHDPGGDVFVCGVFEGTIMIGSLAVASRGGTDIWVARMSASGQPRWAVRFGGRGDDRPARLKLDSEGNLIVVGQITDSASFDDGDRVDGPGGIDVLVVQLAAADGRRVWSVALGGEGDDRARGAAVGPGGVIAVTGEFTGTAAFGGDAFDSAGGLDGFIVQLDAQGAHVWSRAFGSTGDDRGLDVAIDSGGSVYLSAAFHGTVSFGGERPVTANAADWNSALIKYR